jgi:hypothetical protein
MPEPVTEADKLRRLFERAALLGVQTEPRDDESALERLLEAVHHREGELMLLRYAIIRQLTK